MSDPTRLPPGAPPPRPPDLPLIARAIDGWVRQIRAARALDGPEHDRALYHLEMNLLGAIATLEWYAEQDAARPER